MITTGLFTTHRFEIKAKPGETFRLVLFGDIHRDAPLHAGDAWQRDLDYWRGMVKSQPVYFLGMGDYLDGCSTSERAGLRAAKLHESTKHNLEVAWQKSVDDLCEELAFAKGRIVGLIEGNHYPEFSDGTTGTQRMARTLGTTYLGVSSFIRFEIIPHGNSQTALDLWAHHGAGAARLVGGSINRVEQMAEGGIADIYCMGHDHRRMVVPGTPKLFLRHSPKGGLEIKQKQIWLARTGSYLRGYVSGQVSYIADTARSPASIGHVALDITPRRSRTGGKDTLSLDIRGIA